MKLEKVQDQILPTLFRLFQSLSMHSSDVLCPNLLNFGSLVTRGWKVEKTMVIVH